MSVALAPLSLADFLAWEERQELRYEFDGFRPVAMTGGTARHEIIGYRLRTLVQLRLDGKPCRPWGPTAKIEVAQRMRYPDAFVSGTPVPPGATIIPEPVVVFEVLSPSSAYIDRFMKSREYQATASIQRYVMSEQDSIAIWNLVRAGDVWASTPLVGDDVLDMPEIGISLSLPEIYRDAGLEPSQDVAETA